MVKLAAVRGYLHFHTAGFDRGIGERHPHRDFHVIGLEREVGSVLVPADVSVAAGRLGNTVVIGRGY